MWTKCLKAPERNTHSWTFISTVIPWRHLGNRTAWAIHVCESLINKSQISLSRKKERQEKKRKQRNSIVAVFTSKQWVKKPWCGIRAGTVTILSPSEQLCKHNSQLIRGLWHVIRAGLLYILYWNTITAVWSGHNRSLTDDVNPSRG